MISFDIQHHFKKSGFSIAAQGKWPQGKRIALYGPSGTGKTSLILIMTGLMKAQHGYLKVKDQLWFDCAKNNHLKPQKRKVGMVFQDLALFPNMTVAEQLAFARQDSSKSYTVGQMMALCQLSGMEKMLPEQLSGGQKQRLALARALINAPEILLLDEPFNGLDQGVKQQLYRDLKPLFQQIGCTVVMVSHDAEEIANLCEWVYPMKAGKGEELVAVDEFFQPSENRGIFLGLDADDPVYAKVMVGGKVLRIKREAIIEKVTIGEDVRWQW
ncbi:ATP-binding cassette domain-containing protein [Persicobacter psychrovividus]|uniref:GTPase n=1 Tax=Persicobacter psychrovividus TaxID=387638 RepID=A0ABN6LBF8_9BACT|nr:GTPase [Persicobacter psychrovividus]